MLQESGTSNIGYISSKISTDLYLGTNGFFSFGKVFLIYFDLLLSFEWD